MGLERKQNEDMDLALSTDLKPRLKWTAALHQRFIEAVTELGGSERATPMWLMRVMGIPGLSLFHVKSHLQKYRLENKEHSGSCNYNEQDYTETKTLQMEMEMQNKLHERIERHLQWKIEAQGVYLQSMLERAQETLAGCHHSPAGLENSNTSVSELVSSVETECLSLNLRNLTADCSADSTLTSSESSERKGGRLPSVERSHGNRLNGIGPNFVLGGKKRSWSSISDESCLEQSVTTVPSPQQWKPSKLNKLGHSEEAELNFKHTNESTAAAGVELDLNCVPPELFDES